MTLLLSSDSAIDLPAQEGLAKSRYFMLVSKPCNHPECPQRSGYIRGQYESVEFIREIKVAKPLRKVRSSTDLSHGDAAQARQFAEDDLNRDALNRSAHGAGATDGGKRDKTIAFADTEEEELKEKEDFETLVEWLMVTRSDPGGSVPRFMVEKGTPAGIAGDAEKFLKWVQHKKPEELAKAGEQDTEFEDETSSKTEHDQMNHDQKTIVPVSKTNSDSTMKAPEYPQEYEDLPSPGGIYGMISGALSAVAARLPVNPLGSARGGDTDTDPSPSNSSDDDSSDILSFHSADSDLDGDSRLSNTDDNDNLLPPISTSKDGEAQSTHSSESTGGISTSITQHEKELRKLEDKKRKAAEKLERAQERAKNKKGNDSQRDEAAIAKLKEKHDREVQKQEEKYRRDLKRLEEKRAHEKKKAEEKRRKQAEKEVQQNLAMQLEQAKAERDIALKQIDVLKEQVGELQGQNTLLVAKLGKISSPELVDSIKRTDSFKDGKLMDN